MNDPVLCIRCGKVDETEFGLCIECEKTFMKQLPIEPLTVQYPVETCAEYIKATGKMINDLLVYNTMAQFWENRFRLNRTLQRMEYGGIPYPDEHCELCHRNMIVTPVCQQDLGGHVWSAFVYIRIVTIRDVLCIDNVSPETRYLDTDEHFDNRYHVLSRHFNADEYRANFPSVKYEHGSKYPNRSFQAHFYKYWKPS